MLKLTNVDNDKPFYITKPSEISGFGITPCMKDNITFEATRICFGLFSFMVRETPEQILKMMRPRKKR